MEFAFSKIAYNIHIFNQLLPMQKNKIRVTPLLRGGHGTTVDLVIHESSVVYNYVIGHKESLESV